MVGLLDVGNLHEEVAVRGTKVSVIGISGEGLFHLLNKFPEVRKMFSGGMGGEVTGEELIKIAPAAVAAAIAAGCGCPGDERAEQIARSLSVGEQVELLDVIFRLTFPQGVGPFIDTLTKMAGTVSEEVPGVPGWDRGTRSPEQLRRL